MTTVLIILAMHSIIFMMLYTRIYEYHQENRKALKRIEALAAQYFNLNNNQA